MDEEPYELEWAKIVAIIIVLVCLGGAVLFLYQGAQIQARNPFIQVCQSNPSERMGQSCTTQPDCMSKCVERLYEASKNATK